MRKCEVCEGTGEYLAIDGFKYQCYKCGGAKKMGLWDKLRRVLGEVEQLEESAFGLAESIRGLRDHREDLSQAMEQLVKNEDHRILMHSLGITSPIMMWAKDTEGRYRYMNQALCDHLYHGNPEDLVGLNDMEILQKHLQMYPKHNFGALCMNTDAETLAMPQGKLPVKWNEWGVVRDRWEYVIAWKNKYYNQAGEVQGTVGLAYYVTDEVEEIKSIMQSCTCETTKQRLTTYLERFGFGQENTRTFSEIIQEMAYTNRGEHK